MLPWLYLIFLSNWTKYVATHFWTFQLVSMLRQSQFIFPHEQTLSRWAFKTMNSSSLVLFFVHYWLDHFVYHPQWHQHKPPPVLPSHPLLCFCASGVPRWQVNSATLVMPHPRQELIWQKWSDAATIGTTGWARARTSCPQDLCCYHRSKINFWLIHTKSDTTARQAATMMNHS